MTVVSFSCLVFFIFIPGKFSPSVETFGAIGFFIGWCLSSPQPTVSEHQTTCTCLSVVMCILFSVYFDEACNIDNVKWRVSAAVQ